jgi:hypothetical protein
MADQHNNHQSEADGQTVSIGWTMLVRPVNMSLMLMARLSRQGASYWLVMLAETISEIHISNLLHIHHIVGFQKIMFYSSKED